MPTDHAEGGIIEAGGAAPGVDAPQATDVIEAPPSFGKQAMQLVVIPALIVVAVIALAVGLKVIVGASSDLDASIARLQQSGGMGKGPLGIQDPKYKQRWREAKHVADQITQITDPQEKKRLHDQLAGILRNSANGQEIELQVYLLAAIARLGQDGGLALIEQHLDDEHDLVAAGAVQGLMFWSNVEQVRVFTPEVVELLSRQDPQARIAAAWALGTLAQRGDQDVIRALDRAMEAASGDDRDAAWSAAIAQAKLGGDRGARVVSDLLLNREELAQLTVLDVGPDAGRPLTEARQDQVLILTLSHVPQIADSRVWQSVKHLADKDTNRRIRHEARKLMDARPPADD